VSARSVRSARDRVRAHSTAEKIRAHSTAEKIRAQWPILVVAAIGLVALVLVAAGFWRRGALLIGVGVGVAAALRLALPEDRAGLLAVRSKRLDFASMATVSATVIYIAWTIDPLGTS
jgi:uncharacterized membrane protein